MLFRKARVEESDVLTALRKLQLQDEGSVPNDRMDETLPAYYAEMMASGRMVVWVCEDGGEIVATSALILIDYIPSFNNPSGVEGYVASMYTAPAYRRRGIASTLLGHLAEEAKARGIHRVRLRASEQGRHVYKKVGYADSHEWMLLEL